MPEQLPQGAPQLSNLPAACSQVTHSSRSPPAKAKPDEHLSALVEHYRRNRSGASSQRDNLYTECKAERLLLVDVVTEDLLLPYNRVTATFELQSSTLMDRMERFVARQEAPFNRTFSSPRTIYCLPPFAYSVDTQKPLQRIAGSLIFLHNRL